MKLIDFLRPYRVRLLLGTLLVTFAIAPFFENRLFEDLMATAVVVVGFWAISDSRKFMIICGALGGLTALILWSIRWIPGKPVYIAANVVDGLFLFFAILALLSFVFGSRRITLETIAGAICVYLMIGSIWGNAFSILESVTPGSFAGLKSSMAQSAKVESDLPSLTQFHYFSFVTLSTLGYGDITPLSRPARNLAALEAVVGQLYLAVLIARLVSQQEVRSSRDEEDKN